MANRNELPDKLYFKIGEVAQLVGVKAHVLRYWESEFPSIRPQKSKTNQRLYRRSDVEAILAVKHLLYDRKFTTEGAKRHLREQGKEASLPPPDPEAVAAQAKREAQAEMESAVGRAQAKAVAGYEKQLLKMKQEVQAFLAEISADHTEQGELD